MKQNNSTSKSLVLFITLVTSVSFLSGCGSVKKLAGRDAEPATTSKAASQDITRPPQVINNSKSTAVETKPEDTISFEEWREKRLAEQAEAKKQREAEEAESGSQ